MGKGRRPSPLSMNIEKQVNILIQFNFVIPAYARMTGNITISNDNE